ncbi:hypothetical protein [Paraburkholderia caballeronis]|uniref:hypothetical protein n=1 Tax=Paraburkholderia caballeronis TaxID=416943 RepID=UPI001430AD2C|nr:hypothetical protein [Paraburkholderia caballeronis]
MPRISMRGNARTAHKPLARLIRGSAATRDASGAGFVPRMAQTKVPQRAKRIEALGNGQVPHVVVQAWAALRDGAAANDDACGPDAPQLAAGEQS